MKSTNKPVIILLFILWMISISSGEEQEPMLKTKVKIMDGVLYLYWNVSSMMDNSSEVIQFNVKYCPVNQNQKINITICEASYTALPLYGTTSTRQEAFSEYLANDNLNEKLIRSDTSSLLSSAWNRSSRQFMCAIHNVKECLGDFGQKLGAFMITTSVNYTELLEVISDKVDRLLTKPASIVMTQNYNDVTIKWRSSYKCKNDVPDSYHLLLKNHETGQKSVGELITYGMLFKKVWQYTFHSLDPYTIYTVYVYGIQILGNRKGTSGERKFITAEAAPSEAPSIKCSMCVPSKYFQNYRNVTVMWNLPPRNRCNGIIRLTILKFWEEDNPNVTFTLKVDNSTVAVLPSLRRNSKYKFKVKVCTMANLCSAYSKQSNILEEVANIMSRTGSKSLTKAWIIVLSIGIPLASVVVVAVVILLFWFFIYRRQRKPKENEIKTIKLSEDLYLSQSPEQLYKTKSMVNLDEYDFIPDKQEKNGQTIQEKSKS